MKKFWVCALLLTCTLVLAEVGKEVVEDKSRAVPPLQVASPPVSETPPSVNPRSQPVPSPKAVFQRNSSIEKKEELQEAVSEKNEQNAGSRASELKAITTNQVIVIRIADSINPGTADYIMKNIEEAERIGALYLLLVLDTPGGLLSATREIVKKMLNSKVPIVVYIGPQGAHAGSAGALITFAADVAVMAPGTNIGAAHPVVPGSEKIDDKMQQKMANDVAAFAESLAKAKGRNIEWAAKAVRESASIMADQALKESVVDLVAGNETVLVNSILPGYRLKVPKGSISRISQESVSLVHVEMTIKEKLVSFFADPNLAYMIMSLGGLCIWVELTHPGLIFPGVIGAVCIILSLISFQMLPISYGALAFIFLGLAMMVSELFLPTYGLMAVGGLTSFIFGSLFLMDSSIPQFEISLSLILPTAAILAAFAFLLGFLVVRSQRTKNRSGFEALVGEFGEVRELVADKPGMVFVQGELWKAVSETGEEIPVGSLVKVQGARGMVLVVVKS